MGKHNEDDVQWKATNPSRSCVRHVAVNVMVLDTLQNCIKATSGACTAPLPQARLCR